MKSKIILYILTLALEIYDTYKLGFRANIHLIIHHLFKDNRGEVSTPLCDTNRTKKALKGNTGETEIIVTRTFGTADFKELYKRYIRSQLEINNEKQAYGLTNYRTAGYNKPSTVLPERNI